MKGLVIATKKYDFVNRETGEHLQGAHVYYLDPLMRDDNENTKGLLPLKVPVIPRVLEKIQDLPAFYDLEFRHRPDSKGKPQLTLADATLIQSIDFEV